MKRNFTDIAGIPIKTNRNKVFKGDGIHYYKDNGSDILAIAHLDSVIYEPHFYMMTISGKDYVYNSRLDDRIGVYIITKLLPKLGLKFDWLLTTDEEIGRSTARDFIPSKEYKWAFSFDRAGDDVVMYQFRDADLVKRLTKAGLKIGIGSFSDICELDNIGCKCFNVGSGVQSEHSAWASASMTMMISQIRKFLRFYKKNKNVHLPHTYTSYGRYMGGFNDWDDWDDAEYSEKFALDRYKSSTSYVPSDICMGCGKVNRTLRLTAEEHADFCDKCYSIMAVCTGCYAFVPEETLDDAGECVVCSGEAGGEDNFCYCCAKDIIHPNKPSSFGGICIQCYDDYDMGPNDNDGTKENKDEVK